MRHRIKYLRGLLGVTHAELADAARVTRQTVSAIENGVWKPSLLVGMRIARRLGKPVEEVFFEDDDDQPVD